MGASNNLWRMTTVLLAWSLSTLSCGAVAAQDCGDPAASDEMRQIIEETITFNSDGTCNIFYQLRIPASPLADLYKRLLEFPDDPFTPGDDFSGDIPPFADELEQEIPELVEFPAELILNEDPDVEDTGLVTDVADGFFNSPYVNLSRDVRDEIVDAFKALQEYHFGIVQGPLGAVTETLRWGLFGDVVIQIKAMNFEAQVDSGQVFIGPPNLDASLERVGFLLLQMEHVKTLLDPDNADYSNYVRCWKVAIDTSQLGQIQNQAELFAMDQSDAWHQEFGPNDGDNVLDAELTVLTATRLILEESLLVDEQAITASPTDLYLGDFLCYKAFVIDVGVGGGVTGVPDRVTGSAALSRDWTFSIVEGEVTVDFASNIPGVTAEMTLSQTLEARFGVEWEWGWFFELDEFESYLEIGATVGAGFSLKSEFDQTIAPANPFFEWRHSFIFVVLTVPVQITLILDVNGDVTFSIDPDYEIAFDATASGSIRLGTKWDEDKGWRPVRRFDFDTDMDWTLPELDAGEEWTLTVEAGLPMSISALFYNLAGPTATLRPFFRLEFGDDAAKRPDDGCELGRIAGADVSAGVDFIDLLETLGLSDYDWMSLTYVFWEWYDCEQDWDVEIIEVTAPEEVTFGDVVEFSATVTNYSAVENISDVDVDLSVWDSSSAESCLSSGTPLYPATATPVTLNALDPGESRRAAFLWDTKNASSLPTESQLQIVACADLSDAPTAVTDENATTVDWNVRDVEVTDVSASPVSVEQGDDVDIEVTVASHVNGIPTSDILVEVYYRENVAASDWIPIGELWCDYTRLIFDLAGAGASVVTTFTWDTSDVPVNETDGYLLEARIRMQAEDAAETEWDTSNNQLVFQNAAGDPIPIDVTESDNLPPSVGLELPILGAIEIDPGDITFSWTGGPGDDPGDEVEFYLYVGPVPEPPVIVGTTSATSFTPDFPLYDDTVHAWFVDAVDSYGAVTRSEEWTFQTRSAGNFLRGDVNGDADLYALVDAIFLLRYVFLSGAEPPCLKAADADGNGLVEGIADALFVLEYGFVNGPPPPEPFPACGVEGESDLDCEAPPAGCLYLPESGDR